ncbi:MAG TPA: hypothetical protein VGB14_10635 [Acidimicrobiales bacterium]|jgi:hypothetical protein
MTDQDPLQEPENSTVDDWHGQEVDRMTERADQAVADADGDMEEAERRFEEGESDLPPTAAAGEGDEAPSG